MNLPRPNRTNARVVHIEPLLRYLELQKAGSWTFFQSAVKVVLPDLSKAYEIADRLAAECFIEFEWRDRSWRFAPAVLVELKHPYRIDDPDGHGDEIRWQLFGASARVGEGLLRDWLRDHNRSEEAFERFRIASSIRLKDYRLKFDRYVLPTGTDVQLPRVASSSIEAMFVRLPNVRLAGEHWFGSQDQVDIGVLKGAFQPAFYDTAVKQFVEMPFFNGAPGLWRVDGFQRKYYKVSYIGNAASGTREPFIVQVPRDLGRWFEAIEVGTASYERDSQRLTFNLSGGLFDIPLIHEKWLRLSGASRSVQFKYPNIEISFSPVPQRQALTLMQLLAFRNVVKI